MYALAINNGFNIIDDFQASSRLCLPCNPLSLGVARVLIGNIFESSSTVLSEIKDRAAGNPSAAGGRGTDPQSGSRTGAAFTSSNTRTVNLLARFF